MTPKEFRKIALSMPEAAESSHVGHPDFRVNGKVFATLGYPNDDCGALMLTPEEQAKLLRAMPEACSPASGAWGRRGSTVVRLAAVDAKTLRPAITIAWRGKAPKRLQQSPEKT
ncbi:MAG TPA: MmcQ/YjbR family DNA-binding protein [Chthoniobacterales bacterium]|nr:MmcQ/YjbR family DNA-binding protein [Chthoniobacterales bacterium]